MKGHLYSSAVVTGYGIKKQIVEVLEIEIYWQKEVQKVKEDRMQERIRRGWSVIKNLANNKDRNKASHGTYEKLRVVLEGVFLYFMIGTNTPYWTFLKLKVRNSIGIREERIGNKKDSLSSKLMSSREVLIRHKKDHEWYEWVVLAVAYETSRLEWCKDKGNLF